MIENDLLALFIKRVPYVMPNVRAFRRNIIKRKVVIEGREVMLVAGIPGQADAYALVKGGQNIEIETKAAKGRMQVKQEKWRAFCLRWGITHLVLRAKPDEEPEATVNRWCEELRAIL